MSRRGYTSRPPVPEEREVNRLHAEAVKKQKDAAEAAAARKRKRKEKHNKACKIAHAEGRPRHATAESTEAATSAGSPLIYRGAGGEDTTVTLGEVTLVPGSLVEPPPVRTERRSPTPAAGQRSPALAAGRRSTTL